MSGPKYAVLVLRLSDWAKLAHHPVYTKSYHDYSSHLFRSDRNKHRRRRLINHRMISHAMTNHIVINRMFSQLIINHMISRIMVNRPTEKTHSPPSSADEISVQVLHCSKHRGR